MPMWGLRLILILAGIAFVAGVYFYTLRHPPRSRRQEPSRRAEPTVSIDAPQRPVTRPVEAPQRTASARNDPSSERRPTPSEPGTTARKEYDNRPEEKPATESEEKVFFIGLRLPGEGVPAAKVLRDLERLGLTLDDRQIYQQAGSGSEPVFSVANLFEPGVLALLAPDARLRGLSFFFMAQPSTATGSRFDRMLGAAQECARAWGGQLEDTSHRPLTAARELELKLTAVGARSD